MFESNKIGACTAQARFGMLWGSAQGAPQRNSTSGMFGKEGSAWHEFPETLFAFEQSVPKSSQALWGKDFRARKRRCTGPICSDAITSKEPHNRTLSPCKGSRGAGDDGACRARATTTFGCCGCREGRRGISCFGLRV